VLHLESIAERQPPRIVAHLYAYDEADIVGWTVGHLLNQGCEVIVSDNWSTDGTADMLESEFGGLITVIKYPETGPTPTVSWHAMLRCVEEIALAEGSREGCWFLHHDADEIRRAATGESIREFLLRVGSRGYTAVDHELRNYGPREGWDGSQDPEVFLTDRVDSSFDQRIGQVKTWWQTPGVRVDLAGSGGHNVNFPGKRVCPTGVMMKHYPLRSPEQAARKIASRRERWSIAERDMGWHVQYER
jgi:hypothetical protein